MKIKPFLYALFGLTCLALLTPLIVHRDYLFPFISPRALYLRIVIELALPFYVYLVLARKDFRPNLKNPLNISVLAFLLLSFISSLAGVNFMRSFWGNIERMGGVWYLLHLTLLYFYVLLLAQAGGKHILRFLKFFIWIAITSVLYGLWVYLGLPGFFSDPSLPARVSSTFGNPIFFASFLILPMFLTMFFALQEQSRAWRIIYWVAAVLQLFGIYQSATRGAFVGLVGGLLIAAVVYIYKAPSKKFRLYGISAVAGIVVITGLLFAVSGKLNPEGFLYRITHLKDNNSSSRIIQWKTALEGFKDRPLLGTGPENYYLIANKYYDPQQAQFDPSWFDKPHNYLLEILVTTGVLGFAAYAGVLVFFLWALYKALKAGFISWLETCLLFAGMLAYQIQNIFVFDTISASIAFFVYLGFGAYLWYESGLAAAPAKQQKKELGLSPAFVNTALAVSGVLALYSVYLTGIVPGRVAKYINYGYAYASANPQKAVEYFEAARSQPHVFDPGELGSRYEEVAIRIAESRSQNQNSQNNGIDQKFVDQTFGNVIKSLEDAVSRIDNYPIYWYKLGEAYGYRASLGSGGLNPRAVQAAEKAVELAPKRSETLFFLSQMRMFQGRTEDAIKIAKQTVGYYPWSPDVKWRLALIYRMANNEPEAIKAAEEALQQGYVIRQAGEAGWLSDYYIKNQQPQKAVDLYEQALKNTPQSAELLVGLSKLYSQLGQREKAITTIRRILEFQPAAKADVEEYIKTLQ